MIEIGRNIRWKKPYMSEVEFSKSIGCSFMQVWFHRGDLLINSDGMNKVELIKEAKFPIVIHAVIDLAEFEKEVLSVLEILKEIKLKELIIHPICEINPIDSKSIDQLSDVINKASKLLTANDIKLYVENNCRKSPIHYSTKDVNIVFSNNKVIELLLDIAHVDSYEHLIELKNIKYPKMLHLADKHFAVDHEHLPMGEGELNFELIFNDILSDYTGKLILEIDQNDAVITESTKKIKGILNHRTT